MPRAVKVNCPYCNNLYDKRGIKAHIQSHANETAFDKQRTELFNKGAQIKMQKLVGQSVDTNTSLEELFKQRDEYKDKLASIEITITKKLDQMGLSFKPPTEIEQHIGSEDFYGINDDINEGSNE